MALCGALPHAALCLIFDARMSDHRVAHAAVRPTAELAQRVPRVTAQQAILGICANESQ